MKFSKFDTIHLSLTLVSILPLGYWVFLQLDQDLWWDELISLREYALASLETNLTVNPIMNNHIFSNLLINLYTRLIGNREFYDLIGNPTILRGFQLLISISTILYCFKLYYKFVDQRSSFLAIALLISCIPFLNFSLQLRGYSLSMMLLVSVVYHTYSYKKYAKARDLAFVLIAVFAALFTLASNIYVLVSFYLVFFFFELGEVKMKSGTGWYRASLKLLSKRQYLYLIFTLTGSAAISFIAYLPTLDDLLNNRFVDNQPDDTLFVLKTRLVDVSIYLFSKRWLLLPFLLAAPYLVLSSKSVKNLRLLVTLSASIMLPFVLAVLHGTSPYERTFVVIAPIFSLVMAMVIYNTISHSKLSKKSETLTYSGLIIYLSLWAMVEIKANDQILVNNSRHGIKEQNIYRNFYHASNFNPNQISERLKILGADNTRTILVNEIDRVSLGYYLIKNEIKSSSPIATEPYITVRGDKQYDNRLLVQKVEDKHSEMSFTNFVYNQNESHVYNNHELMVFMESDNIQKDHLFMLTTDVKPLTESKIITSFYHIQLKDRTGFVHIYELVEKD